MRKLDIGLRQAKLLCQMNHRERLDFIAEGLPLILESARGLWAASRQLNDAPREANILEGHAEEEAAKILILMDIIRCPQKLAGSRIGPMVKWFYDHLSRLIYARAVTWKPMHVNQLREYVDSQRKAHFVEGYMGEYILPNWEIYSRESTSNSKSRSFWDSQIDKNLIQGWDAALALPTVRPRGRLCDFSGPAAGTRRQHRDR